MENEPFANFFDLVYPRYLDAMASDGYYLSDLDLLLLRECAKRNAVILCRLRALGDPQRAVFKVHEWVRPAGRLQVFTPVAVGSEERATSVRGHSER